MRRGDLPAKTAVSRANFAVAFFLSSFVGGTYYYSVMRMSSQDDLEAAALELGVKK